MRNLKLTLSYDGTRYQGFTKPKTKEKDSTQTVSAKLTETLNRLTGEEIELFGGAKTETGVHALLQTVNFKTNCPLSADELRQALNHYLPQDICIFTVEEVPERFHAALNAGAKTYEYRIINRPVSDVFQRKYALHLAQPLDVAAMKEAARLLTGKRDFQFFSAGGCTGYFLRLCYPGKPDAGIGNPAGRSAGYAECIPAVPVGYHGSVGSFQGNGGDPHRN